jgi:hypothetical protein
MSALADRVLSLCLPEETICHQLSGIRSELLANSRHIKEPNFTAIDPRDVEFLFDAYDSRFLDGLCRPALAGRRLTWKLSGLLTRSGGITKHIRHRGGEVSFEIMIASAMLFEGFREGSGPASVAGVECHTRVDALQRIVEHELIHLLEFLCWDTSNCSKPRFQEIASRLFLHRAHTHSLMTRRVQAAKLGIRRGSLVMFHFQGRPVVGRVARVSRRATVLVEDAKGVRYTDGKFYAKYSVGIGALTPV